MFGLEGRWGSACWAKSALLAIYWMSNLAETSGVVLPVLRQTFTVLALLSSLSLPLRNASVFEKSFEFRVV